MSASKPVRRITIADIARMYEEGERFATITAYDFPTARIVDEAGIPLILVGNSLGMVMLGYDTTVRVSIDEMLHHTRAVARGAKRSMVVGDMPFLGDASPPRSPSSTPAASSRRPTRRPSRSGRRALRPHRRVHRQQRHPGHGPYRPDPASREPARWLPRAGSSKESARKLIADALAVQEAGAFAGGGAGTSRVCARDHRAALHPTIGIGAGRIPRPKSRLSTDIMGLDPGLHAVDTCAARRGRPGHLRPRSKAEPRTRPPVASSWARVSRG